MLQILTAAIHEPKQKHRLQRDQPLLEVEAVADEVPFLHRGDIDDAQRGGPHRPRQRPPDLPHMAPSAQSLLTTWLLTGGGKAHHEKRPLVGGWPEAPPPPPPEERKRKESARPAPLFLCQSRPGRGRGNFCSRFPGRPPNRFPPLYSPVALTGSLALPLPIIGEGSGRGGAGGVHRRAYHWGQRKSRSGSPPRGGGHFKRVLQVTFEVGERLSGL